MIYKNFSTEDRAIVILAMEFEKAISERLNLECDRLQAVSHEFFKATPSISHADFPLIYTALQDFYCKLQGEKDDIDTNPDVQFVYDELYTKCSSLLERVRGICMYYGFDAEMPMYS